MSDRTSAREMSILIPCQDVCCVLVLERDPFEHGDDETYLSVLAHQQGGRLRRAWGVLRGKDGSCWDMLLSKDQVRQLRDHFDRALDRPKPNVQFVGDVLAASAERALDVHQHLRPIVEGTPPTECLPDDVHREMSSAGRELRDVYRQVKQSLAKHEDAGLRILFEELERWRRWREDNDLPARW